MRAVRFGNYGPPEVLESVETARPEPGPGEVLLRVVAAGMNPADHVLRSGRLRLVARLELPFVPGSDVAGAVEAVGDGVTRFEAGDTVYAMLPAATGGGYAGHAVVPETDAAPAPAGLTFAEAAAVPLAALTALQALRDRAGLGPDDRVLVNGASGGVGSFAVQIAGAIGARVTAASSGRNAELVRGLGAEEVLDYTQTDLTAGGATYDVIFDAVGAYPLRRWRRSLRPGGVTVTTNPALGNPVSRWLARATGGGRRFESVMVRPSGVDLETVGAWISVGKVRPVVDRAYPLSDATEAHRYSGTKRARGKLVLIVDERLAGRQVRSWDKRTSRV